MSYALWWYEQTVLMSASTDLVISENAALPHGSGSNRLLGKSDFALFDCTASLHGYQSDVTRVSAPLISVNFS